MRRLLNTRQHPAIYRRRRKMRKLLSPEQRHHHHHHPHPHHQRIVLIWCDYHKLSPNPSSCADDGRSYFFTLKCFEPFASLGCLCRRYTMSSRIYMVLHKKHATFIFTITLTNVDQFNSSFTARWTTEKDWPNSTTSPQSCCRITLRKWTFNSATLRTR